MKSILRIGFVLLCLSIAGSAVSTLAADEARQAYDKMVEESTREADEYVQEKQKEHQAAAARAKTDDSLDERVKAERERIIADMDTTRGRGLSSTFTQGMKDNLLQDLQDKLNRLNMDPKAYFGEK